jgi:hypothetical protein
VFHSGRTARGPEPPKPRNPGTLRRILLGITLLTVLGLVTELSLLDHRDSAIQWTPYVVLVIALASTIQVAVRPTRMVLRVFQGVMVLQIVAGLAGLAFHYKGNVEFELERDESLRGLKLFWEAIRGATPTLAPGALAQLGLVGLAFTYRHPALAESAPEAASMDGTDQEKEGS